ncbi:MAG: DUF4249 domain-containing protein [Chitinophaga sp.]|uniref:DUF4249 domain-containing protein n=1 Tax=Chitinophaga sp. TaxID=1869181 RepID=UPI0025C0DDAC|nr:DUF4249 domain-containing protein [Chitinophaga sp.]MBV8252464.1 DUF4249 domain-containing protein [Chitinophaga sp.]
MKKILFYIVIVCLGALTACTDTINLNVPKGQSFPVLDAWVTTEPGIQKIRITMSVPYTDQAPAPIVSDAKIILNDLTTGDSYPFLFKDNLYQYDATNKAIGVVGHVYKLHVELQGEILEGIDTIKRVPPIDSMTYEYKAKGESTSGKEGYYCRFYAIDIKGATDYYWIRSYRNDSLHRVRDEFSIDGSYSEGVSDGAQFILPIAQSITDGQHPWLLNDKVIMRLSSCSKPSFDFLKQVDQQVNAGGLFAKVLENVKSNMQNTTTNGKVKLLGWFGTSAVSRAEITIK